MHTHTSVVTVTTWVLSQSPFLDTHTTWVNSQIPFFSDSSWEKSANHNNYNLCCLNLIYYTLFNMCLKHILSDCLFFLIHPQLKRYISVFDTIAQKLILPVKHDLPQPLGGPEEQFIFSFNSIKSDFCTMKYILL